MKSNEGLQQDVEDAIKCEPSLHAAEIGVTVKDGIVTLSGTVDNYSKKLQAEHAAKNVAGVTAVVEKIAIQIPSKEMKTDEEIASMAVKALQNSWSVPFEKMMLKVEKGWVYLDGEFPWNYQREAAKRAVDGVKGVKGIINNIKIKAATHNKIEEKLIKDALIRHWSINANDIDVRVNGNTVILSGVVTSLYEKEEAARIAWRTPGIWSIENNLIVDHHFSLV